MDALAGVNVQRGCEAFANSELERGLLRKPWVWTSWLWSQSVFRRRDVGLPLAPRLTSFRRLYQLVLLGTRPWERGVSQWMLHVLPSLQARCLVPQKEQWVSVWLSIVSR